MHLTPDAIPTNEQLRESLADRFYHPYRKQIWVAGAVLVGVVLWLLGSREYRHAREESKWSRYHEAVRGFSPSPVGTPDRGSAAKTADSLRVLVSDFPNSSVTPVALEAMCQAQVQLGDFDGALKTLDEIRTRFKDFALNTLPADPDSAGKPRSLAERLEFLINKEKLWAPKRNYVHHWPSEERLALVETNLGSFWLGFYSAKDEAPNHVESFIQHAKNGDYNGTQVYSVVQDQNSSPMTFEAGSLLSCLDPAKKDKAVADPSEQDRDEPTGTIDPEDTRTLIRHQYRVVSAAPMDSGESATRFRVVTKREGMEKFNGRYTPFAAVLDREKSLETIDRIARAPTYSTNTETKESPGVLRMNDHPFPRVYIRRVTIWTAEKLEDGHVWDTERRASDQPEPWEKDLPPDPRPQDFLKK